MKANSKLSDELLAALQDTDGEPKHAAMLEALSQAQGCRGSVLAAACYAVRVAQYSHSRALRILREREKLITDEALKLLESGGAMEKTA